MGIFNKMKRPEKYSNPSPKTPAEKAQSVWDDREGKIIVRMANLRKIIIGLLVLSVVLTGGLVFQSLKSSVVPYIVEVDRSTGEVKNAGVLRKGDYTPQEAETGFFIKKFIKNSREVQLDPVVYKDHWKEAFAFLTKDSANKMNSIIKKEKLNDRFGASTVQVQIVSCLPMEGSNSWQVRWKEEEFSITSGSKKVTPMTAIVTITNIPSKDEAALELNPLGIYVTDFSWSKDTVESSTATQNTSKAKPRA